MNQGVKLVVRSLKRLASAVQLRPWPVMRAFWGTDRLAMTVWRTGLRLRGP